jgi:putative FmdB family regulatory protein
MPTYEYKCDACGHQFEKFQSITAAPIKKCPVCGKSRVRRLIGTGAGLIFKGGGFYITDYRSESYKSGAKAESGEKAPASKDNSTAASGDSASKPANDSKPASDSKPAAKSSSEPKAVSAATKSSKSSK